MRRMTREELEVLIVTVIQSYPRDPYNAGNIIMWLLDEMGVLDSIWEEW